ncbi:MAG: ABC transporter permease [Faecousia sp.]
MRKKQSKSVRLGQKTWKEDLKKNWVLYMLFVPVLIWELLFHYLPMPGLIMAFQDYRVAKGFLGSDFVGWQNFIDLFTGDGFTLAFRNTCAMALLSITVGFFPPVLFAIVLTTFPHKKLRRGFQLASYLPNFVSAVVMCSLASEFLSSKGAITQLLCLFGAEKQNWLANPNIPVFWIIYTLIGVWQGIGWGSIVYVAAINNINGELQEAAAIDGANRFRRITNIVIPGILPMVIMLWTINIGMVFKMVGNNILLLYMPKTYEVADVLSTYTYRMSFGGSANYGLSTASGLFQSVLGTILLVVSNKLSKKATSYSLF